MKIDRDTLKAIRPDIDAALALIAEKHDLASLKTGGASFDPRAGCFTIKVDGVAAGGVDKDGAIYEASRGLYGLPPLGTMFKSGRTDYKIVGMNNTGSKVIVAAGEKRYLFRTEDVARIAEAQQ